MGGRENEKTFGEVLLRDHVGEDQLLPERGQELAARTGGDVSVQMLPA
eukprot:COSAG02_NODE_3650_length_6422_cov_15.219516_3_plen_48_part_00